MFSDIRRVNIMCRRLSLFIVIALQVVLAGNAFAGNANDGFVWWSSGGGADYRWTTFSNWWRAGGPPTYDQNAALDSPVPCFGVVNESTTDPIDANKGPTCFDLQVGDWSQEVPAAATLDVNHQTLNVTRDIIIGVRETTWWPAGVRAIGDVNVYNGGKINVGRDLWVGSEGVGSLEVNSNGDVNIAGTLRCPGGPQPSYGNQRYTYGTGKITLSGGTIEANDIYSYNETSNEIAQINICGGTLKLNGDKTSQIADLIAQGKLYAYDTAGDIQCDYNVRNAGKTTVTATSNPFLASRPSPGNYATDANLDANLSWTPAASAASHRVYFSTSFIDVNDGNASAQKQDSSQTYYEPNHPLTQEQTYFWRIDEVNATKAEPNYWKGNVWRFTAKNPYIASLPIPTNKKVDVDVNVTLSWTKGATAINHNVYIGTSFNDVNTSTTPTANTTEPNYHPSLQVNWTYYWRVDENEVNGTTWKGPVWRFSTQANRPIDNFNSGPITWTRGGGATVSIATPTFPASDYNAMMFAYDNSVAPWYSEANCTAYQFGLPAAKRDWTLGGVKVLGISFHGDANNAIELLYITVKDTVNSVTVWYTDSNDIKQQANEYWHWWPVDLKILSNGGINLSDVRKLIIGLGDKASPGGSGTVYFDSIALYPSQCLNQNGDADLNNDCVVDVNDLVILAQDWLKRSYQVTAANSVDPNGLVLRYKFDTNDLYSVYIDEYEYGCFHDSSGNDYNGILYGAYNGNGSGNLDPVGHDGNGAFNFDAALPIYLDVPINSMNDVNLLGGKSTVAFWIKDNGQPAGKMLFQICNSDRGNLQVWSDWTGYYSYTCGWDPCNLYRDSLSWGRYNYTNPEHVLGQWNHYAFTKDYNTAGMRIYLNGIAVAEYSDANYPIMAPPRGNPYDFFTIAAWQYSDGAGGYYTGTMDDFRLYNRALSQAEIVYLAKGSGSSITQPVLSQANVNGDSQVDFKDFAVVAEAWLRNPLLWP
jgi:hypothetical protein